MSLFKLFLLTFKLGTVIVRPGSFDLTKVVKAPFMIRQ